MGKKLIIVSVTGDIVTDQRVSRICSTLFSAGFDIILTGRILRGSLPLAPRPYKTRRVRHLFNKKFFFYAEYNLRLLIYLLFTPFDLLHANDLDTLPANYLASRIKRKPLIYDSHEFFTGVPELNDRPVIKWCWEMIEKFIFPRLRCIITVNSAIAGVYEEKYARDVHVVRNVPEPVTFKDPLPPSHYGLPDNKKLVILQGRWINRDRGAEEAVLAMQYIENAVLVIAGGGDIIPALKKTAGEKNLMGKVYFIPPMPYEELMKLTSICHCGLSLDKDTCLNYRYSLPNKLFDYIMAGIPVLASPLPEVRKIIEKYETGLIIESHEPREIAKKLHTILFTRPRENWREKLTRAAGELNWDNEKEKLLEVYREFR
jgi:glycosyltransferase involved in cell wall biosynthesis